MSKSKESSAMHEVQEMQVVGGREDPTEKGMTTQCSILKSSMGEGAWQAASPTGCVQQAEKSGT